MFDPRAIDLGILKSDPERAGQLLLNPEVSAQFLKAIFEFLEANFTFWRRFLIFCGGDEMSNLSVLGLWRNFAFLG